MLYLPGVIINMIVGMSLSLTQIFYYLLLSTVFMQRMVLLMVLV